MYERSAIVLENYFEKVLGLNKENNLRNNYENYNKIVEEIKEYQRMVEEEEKVINKFDESASEIESIQEKQSKIHEENVKLEEERDILFNDLGENTSVLDQKLQKIEDTFDKNNEILKDLREKYVKALVIFTERQKERNKYARIHRKEEANYLEILKNTNEKFEIFNYKQIQDIKKYMENEEENNEEIIERMLKNGKSERVPFDEQVIRKAVEERSKIAREETDLYISIYERMKKLLLEIRNGAVRLAKSEKLLRDVSVKLEFLRGKKEYIIGFLDNERMTAMNGRKVHGRLMEEACKNFDLDIKQIDNLYELIKKETAGKATKKSYKELYNKTYLKEIDEKERNFEEEAINIKINMGTLINFNYWRIEGIKNIYNIFQEQISEKFNKDLSEYSITEVVEEKKIDKVDRIEDIKVTKLVEITDDADDSDDADDYEDEEYNQDYDDEDDYEYVEDDDYEDEDYEEYENEDYEDVVFDDEEEAGINGNEEYDEEEYYDDEYDEDEIDEEEFDDDIEPYKYNYYDDEDEEEEDYFIEQDDDEITEEKIDQLIKNSRKRKKDYKQEKGLFGKLFKK